MVLKIVCWQIKKIYQIIFELTSIKIIWDIRIIEISPGGENNQPCWTYSVREPQVDRDALWKTITA